MAEKQLIISSADQLLQPTTRRRFLGLLGVAGSVVLLPGVFAACNDDTSTNPGTKGMTEWFLTTGSWHSSPAACDDCN